MKKRNGISLMVLVITITLAITLVSVSYFGISKYEEFRKRETLLDILDFCKFEVDSYYTKTGKLPVEDVLDNSITQRFTQYGNTIDILNQWQSYNGYTIPNIERENAKSRYMFLSFNRLGQRLPEYMQKELTKNGLEVVVSEYTHEVYYIFNRPYKEGISASSAPNTLKKDINLVIARRERQYAK